MSLMSPNGAALMAGAQAGMRMAAARQAQQQRAAAAQNGALDDQLKLYNDLDSDVRDLGKAVKEASPEDLPRYEAIHTEMSSRYKRLGLNFPSWGLFSGSAPGGFGNSSKPGEYFTGKGDIANASVSSALQEWVYSVPYAELLTPAGLAKYDLDLTRQMNTAGLTPQWQEVYRKQLHERAKEAETRIAAGVTRFKDKQSFINAEIEKVRDIAATAYRATGSTFLGGPQSGVDPDMQAPYLIIQQRAARLMSDAYDDGRPMSAEEAISRIRDLYPGNKEIQKAVGNMIKLSDGTMFSPDSGAVSPPLPAIPPLLQGPAYQAASQPPAGDPFPPRAAVPPAPARGAAAPPAAVPRRPAPAAPDTSSSVEYSVAGTDSLGAPVYAVKYKGRTVLMSAEKWAEAQKQFLKGGGN